jgi:N-acetyl-anhydromuramyl-L-alanine amidase AmpD
MRFTALLILGLLFLNPVHSQVNFQTVYDHHPFVPKGLLEGVAWTNTRMVHLSLNDEGCSGIPLPYGIMGLHDNGKNYFKENGLLIADLSGISVAEQKANPQQQVEAYAIAYEHLLSDQNLDPQSPFTVREILHQLSELPDTGYVNFLAHEMQVYEVLRFMKSADHASTYGFSSHHFDLALIFGADNYSVLSSDRISFSTNGIRGANNELFSIDQEKSLQYGPAIWTPAPSCNFSSRNGVAVSAITIHTVQGSYAGAISWAQNCSSNVSYHYVIRSSDGQVTQMVLEEDKGWHVGSENPYTIGYEHEGFVDNPAWYTEAMYQSSADLSRDIVNSGYGISPLRTFYGDATVGINTLGGCTKIKGHQHYPNQTHTDPGINWDWEKYYKLINNTYTPNVITSSSGTLYDTGGAGNDYQDDERNLWLIAPSGASSVSLDFQMFDLETDYDYLFIYDGDSTDAPLIGKYTGMNSPGMITSSGGSILLEFRSDCATVAPGWAVDFTSTLSDGIAPTTSILNAPSWVTQDFVAEFLDVDSQSGIAERYYNISERPFISDQPGADGSKGFIRNHAVNSTISPSWIVNSGSFTEGLFGHFQSDTLEQNSNYYTMFDQDSLHSYLYQWTQNIYPNTVENERAGIHFFCDDPTLDNRGNSYFVYLRASGDKVQIYSVDNDVFTLQSNVDYNIDSLTNYTVQVTYNPETGWIKVYIDELFVSSWQDPTPLKSGNSISLRTGGCETLFGDIYVYRSRSEQETITVGPTGDFSVQSDYADPSGYIKSIVIDSANNISSSYQEQYLVDYSVPTVDYLNDGSGNDIDTFYTSTIEANWLTEDIHSGIANYEYAVGTLPNLDDVISWTSNGTNELMAEVLASPIYNQVYHVSVRVVNGAGLENTFTSNGQRYLQGLGMDENELEQIVLYPNPATNKVSLKGVNGIVDYSLYDQYGKLIAQGTTTDTIVLSDLAQGIYNVVLTKGQQFIVKQLIKQ